MSPIQLNLLLKRGAQDAVRLHLKKQTIDERMRTLNELMPYVNSTPSSLKFFHENFALEIGALISAKYDTKLAEETYRAAKEFAATTKKR